MKLKHNEYINVWDSCGLYGYDIPWPRWKTFGLFMTGIQRRDVDLKSVTLTTRERLELMPKEYESVGVICVQDFIPAEEEMPDWGAVCNAIIKTALENDFVLKGPVQPGYYEE